MITDWQFQRKGEAILLGVAIGQALIDVVTDRSLLSSCLTMLESPHTGLVDTRMGSFGDYPVTLNLDHADEVSIFIDGPDFDSPRNQSAAIWVDKKRLCEIIREVIRGD